MTEQTEQDQRPLAEVEATVEQIRSSAPGAGADSPIETARKGAQQAVERVRQDPRSVAFLAIALTALISVILVAVTSRLRPQPRTAEDLLLERSREAFDQSRDALEAAIAKLASSIER